MSNGRALVAAALFVTLAACDDGETTPSTTISVPASTTTAAEGATTTTTELGQTSTTLRGQVITEYQTVGRISTANGEVLHLLIPVGGYTDIDLHNFLADLKQADPELWGAEIFDHPDAPDAFAVPEASRTTEQLDLLDRHHLASLVSGDTIRYQGPFRSVGESVIGS